MKLMVSSVSFRYECPIQFDSAGSLFEAEPRQNITDGIGVHLLAFTIDRQLHRHIIDRGEHLEEEDHRDQDEHRYEDRNAVSEDKAKE